MKRYHCAVGELEASLALVFEDVAADCEAHVQIVLPVELRINRAIIDPVVRAISGCPDLVEVVFVHPNALLGFICSSIALQAGRVRVRSTSKTD